MSDPKTFSCVSGQAEGPALLLSNSLGTTHRMWDAQLSMLEQHFKVIRYDTRGHGQSATPSGPYSFDDLVDDAFAVLDQHGAATASVMGCSLGSMTALGMGLRDPERVDRIVCSAARSDAPAPFKQSWDDRVAVIAEKGVAGLWDGTLGNWLTPAFREENPSIVALLKSDFLMTTEDGYRGCAMALKGLDYFKELGNLAAPVLCVAGSEDKGAPPAVMMEIAEACGNGQFVLIPEAGHIICVNSPDRFNNAISPFLGAGLDGTA